ncbi:MAG: hypothetical protein F6K41_37475, partial [Symploca sp. SIO3E6]|nr:hypothetical protein [Caldora sp. SIO3E6]
MQHGEDSPPVKTGSKAYVKIDAPGAGAWRRGDAGTRGRGGVETRGRGDAGTRREGFSCMVVKIYSWRLPPASCLL